MVIYPVTLLRTAMGAAERVLETIAVEGTQAGSVSEMLTRARLYELVDYEGHTRFDTSVFDFEVPPAAPSPDTAVDPRGETWEIGRATCREREEDGDSG